MSTQGMVHANPPTLLEVLLECSEQIETLRATPGVTPEQVLHAWETRMSHLIGKVVSTPTATSFCLWRSSDASVP